ncbi:hypothetical protein B6S12_05730 [Helicobacter valdiviensis]|uniref:Uncharacterized protein n=1 Tax=Helicobacter valdiviensis TaxID=1458358 RepID=A0A2W6PN03_9HELI|nr:hypothetical protein B6S12_05730 [Helicobacter valdiviensis]
MYIDDAIKGNTLEDLKDDIVAGGGCINLANNEVIRANQETIKKIKKKLDNYKLSYKEHAFGEYSTKMVKKIEDDIMGLGWDKVIGIELCGIAKDKHIGYLDNYLLENSDANLLYLCATKSSLDNVLKRFLDNPLKHRIYAVCFPLEYTDKISFLKVLCKTSLNNNKNKNVPTFYLGHALNDWSNVDMERYYEDKIDYLSLGLKKFSPKNLTSIKTIECGYLGFDLIAKEIKLKSCKDSIVFAPYHEEEFFKFLPFMQEILNKYRVIYRDRQFFEGRHLWIEANKKIKELQKHPNFFIEGDWWMRGELYSRSFAFVGGITTAINTFPVLALAPSISDNKLLDLELGIRVEFEKDDLLEIVDDIYKNRLIWKEKLLSYREQSFFNFGNASEVLGEFIISNFLKL